MENCIHISSYVKLHNNIIVITKHYIHILAPVPSPTVMVNQLQSTTLFVGSNFTLNCVIMLNMELVHSGRQVFVKWTGPFKIEGTEVQQSNGSHLQYTTQIHVAEASLNHSGNYSCEAQVMATTSQYLISSMLSVDTIKIDISKYTYFTPLRISDIRMLLPVLYLHCCAINFTLCILVSAPSAPMIVKILSSNSTTVEIVWMTGSESDIVHNVTVQFLYQGPCSCSNNSMEQCQLKTLPDTSSHTYSYTISSLRGHSEYTFQVIAENPAGQSAPAEKNITTLSAGRYNKNH